MRIEDGDAAADSHGLVEVELRPGQSVRVGDHVCTVVEVSPGEVALRVDRVLPPALAAPLARRAAVLAGLAR